MSWQTYMTPWLKHALILEQLLFLRSCSNQSLVPVLCSFSLLYISANHVSFLWERKHQNWVVWSSTNLFSHFYWLFCFLINKLSLGLSHWLNVLILKISTDSMTREISNASHIGKQLLKSSYGQYISFFLCFLTCSFLCRNKSDVCTNVYSSVSNTTPWSNAFSCTKVLK